MKIKWPVEGARVIAAPLKRQHASAASLIGRPPTLTSEQKLVVRRLLAEGRSVSSVAREFQTTRQTILRAKDSPEDSRKTLDHADARRTRGGT
ncbi:Helix-turn-helix domain of resolvase [compost metagenome]